VSIAAHSPLMKYAQKDFNQAVFLTPISAPYTPVIGNVNAAPLSTIEEIRSDLQAQLTHRVRWTETIEYMISNGVRNFMELGNGNVLSGLVKRIDRDALIMPLGEPDDFENLANKNP
jgi:[acyl-carrier-protein] S-malonyltransferase